jgi:DNA polymerase-3 subunit beta
MGVQLGASTEERTVKHIATIPAALVKAAMLFQAKWDVRYYLNGIYITQDHIVATDGHSMFVSPYESDRRPEEPLIIAVKGKIPPKAFNLELLYDEESKVGVIRSVGPKPLRIRVVDPRLHAASCDWKDPEPMAVLDKDGHPQNVFFAKVDGRFPDWQRVVPKGDLVPTERIGLDFTYADRVAKACKELGSKFAQCAINLRGPTNSIEIELKSCEYQGAKAIIMPVRLD